MAIIDDVVGKGLADPAEECVSLYLQFLATLCKRVPVQVLNSIEGLSATFQKLFSSNVTLLKAKEKQEKALNILRGVLRICYILNRSDEVQEQRPVCFEEFMRLVNGRQETKELYAKLEASSTSIY